MPSFSGPPEISLNMTSGWGPFAGRGTLAVHRYVVPVVNSGAKPVRLIQLGLDKLRDAATGFLAGGEINPELELGSLPLRLEPGESCNIAIAGSAPARPSAYASALRLRPEEGDELVVPVKVKVAAHPGWGIACMVAGAAMLGLIDLLTGESAVQSKLRDLLRYRETVHAALEHAPPPESRAASLVTFDREVTAGLAAVGRPREWGFADHRIDDADFHWRLAQQIGDDLQHVATAAPPASAEVEDLEKEWRALQTHMKEIRAETDNDASGPALPGLTGSLAGWMANFRHVYLGVPLAAYANQLASPVDRVRLALESGDAQQARALAITVRRWLRRAAGDLDSRMALVLAYAASSNAMALTDLRVRAEAANLPEDVRQQVLGPLDDAAAGVEPDASLADIEAAYRATEEARTRLTRAQANAAVARAQRVAEGVGTEISETEVSRVTAEVVVQHPHSAEEKAAGLLEIGKAWQGVIAAVPDKVQRRALQTALDEATAALKRVDLTAGLAAMRKLQSEWAAYGQRRLAAETQRAVAPFCGTMEADLRQQLLAIGHSLALLGARPEVPFWEQRLDRIRVGAARLSGGNCLDSLSELGAQAVSLGGEIFTASIGAAQISAEARLAAARSSDVAEAMALAQRLMTGPRQIKVLPITPEQERYAGRLLRFQVAELDPVWGPGVAVGVDFGDHSPPLLADAERLRQGLAVEHAYAGPVTAEVRATAAAQLRPGGIDPAGEALGEGRAWVFVLPSPITTAQKAADIFFNAQFLIALLIAGAVYFWQFHARERLFGVRGYDYAEAFALGFVADAAMAELPQRFTKMLGF